MRTANVFLPLMLFFFCPLLVMSCALRETVPISVDELIDNTAKYASKIVDVQGEIIMDYHGPILCDPKENGVFVRLPDSIFPTPDFKLEKDHLFDEYERLSIEIGLVQKRLGKAKLFATLRGRYELFESLPNGKEVTIQDPKGSLVQHRFVLQRILELHVQTIQTKKPLQKAP
jgi:hypothetical protein